MNLWMSWRGQSNYSSVCLVWYHEYIDFFRVDFIPVCKGVWEAQKCGNHLKNLELSLKSKLEVRFENPPTMLKPIARCSFIKLYPVCFKSGFSFELPPHGTLYPFEIITHCIVLQFIISSFYIFQSFSHIQSISHHYSFQRRYVLFLVRFGLVFNGKSIVAQLLHLTSIRTYIGYLLL